MSDRKKKIYNTIIDGATDGLSVEALFAFVKDNHPKASSKKIARTALLALSDPHLRDRNILNTIYALALKHRLDPENTLENDDDSPHDLSAEGNDRKPSNEDSGSKQRKAKGERPAA